MRTETVRRQVHELIHAQPFRRFALTLESGQQVVIGHPENIAFEPDSNGRPGSPDFFVLSAGLRVFSTFEAVTSVSMLDEGVRP